MAAQRTLAVWVVGLAAAASATAQPQGSLRWPGAAHADRGLGLHAGGADFRVPCGSLAFPCQGGGATLPLYSSPLKPRSLDVQVGYLAPTAADHVIARTQPQGLNVSLVGKAALPYDLGVYGRFGTLLGSTAGAAASEGPALSYGVGLSWDFSPRASAMLGWDSYDFRTAAGEREVRSTSLGLRWRY